MNSRIEALFQEFLEKTVSKEEEELSVRERFIFHVMIVQ